MVSIETLSLLLVVVLLLLLLLRRLVKDDEGGQNTSSNQGNRFLRGLRGLDKPRTLHTVYGISVSPSLYVERRRKKVGFDIFGSHNLVFVSFGMPYLITMMRRNGTQ